MTRQFARIVYLDGEEGREVVDRLCNVDGVMAYGPTADSIVAAVDHLKQWDYADEDEWEPSLGTGNDDQTCRVGEYLLTWHRGLGYVSLYRVKESE